MQNRFELMKKIVFLTIAASLLAFVSCQKGDGAGQVSLDGDRLPIQLSLSLQTKATDAGYENGDKIGVYVSYQNGLEPSGNYLDNVGFSLQNGVWEADATIYWADKTTPADFYCYYPYGVPFNARSYNFTVKSDQSTKANYSASDFLWGRTLGAAPGTGVVSISTSHIMSNILVYLEPGEGFAPQEFAEAEKSLKICNVKNNSLIDLQSGTVAATGDVAVITPYWTGECYRAVVVPQSIGTDANFIVLTVNGVTYSLAREFVFQSGTQHRLTVKVNKLSSGLSVTIESWSIDDTEYTGNAN